MRYATAPNLGTSSYSELLDSCQHSRLRAALQSHLPASLSTYSNAQVTQTYETVSNTTRAYLCVVGMSMLSLVSVIVAGTITV